ncbi:CAP domain-containing protein [Streptomyces sp. XH2]|uniref:CAP domain-containing protein n=1 Tax=Streptomyces sp. XH2 TaxID=3412483 RepID=UPI003C7CE51A
MRISTEKSPTKSPIKSLKKSHIWGGLALASLGLAALPATAQAAAQAGPLVGLAGKCLDVRGGNTDDGTPVQIYSCNYTASQVWRFDGGNQTPNPTPNPNPNPNPSPGGTLQRQVFDLVNDYRAQHGKARLEYDPVVERAAQAEADEQARRQQQGHYINTGDSLRKYGYSRAWSAVAENAAGARGFWKDARSVVDAWIKEPLHERNILGDQYKYTGVGVTVDGSGTYWWAQDFVG